MIPFIFNFLFSLNRKVKIILQLLLDSFLISIGFTIAFLLRLDGLDFIFYTNFLLSLVLLNLITLVTFIYFGLYRTVIRFISGSFFIKKLTLSVFVSSLSIYLFSFVLDIILPRSIPIIYFLILLTLIGGSRLLLKEIHFSMNNANIAFFIIRVAILCASVSSVLPRGNRDN